MGIIVDVIIILILLVCIFLGYKRGLAKCLLKLCTSLIAIILAVMLYKPLATFIVESTTIDENIQYSFEKIINQNDTSSEEANNKEVINEDCGLPKPVVEYINNNIANNVKEKKEDAVSEVSHGAAILIINITSVIIIYIISKILLQILTVFTDIVSKLPIIKQCNELGGIIYGVLEAIVIIWLTLTIISMIMPLIGDYAISNAIMQSYIAKFFYNSNLFLSIIF